MHSLSNLEKQLETIDVTKIPSRKEAMKFVEIEKAVLDKLCLDKNERSHCKEIIDFWKQQYKDRYVSTYDENTGKNVKKLQKGDYIQLCKNVFSLERIKAQCITLDIKLIRDLLVNTDGDSLKRYLGANESENQIQQSYSVKQGNGMHLLNHKGKPTTGIHYSGRRGKMRETEDMIEEARKEHPY